MIIKINFDDGLSILFGNSYKKYDEQVQEYMQLFAEFIQPIASVEVCNKKWIGKGGVKWCDYLNFQNELNDENCNRKIKDFIFYKVSENGDTYNTVVKYYNQGQRFLKIKNMTDDEYKKYKNGDIKL